MASVDYIPVGEPISAVDMTALWHELDRRTGILFDRKSVLLAGGIDRRFFGMPFYFIGPGTNWVLGLDSPFSEISYDHGIFTRAAANLEEVERDDTKKILTVANPSSDDYAAIGLDPSRLEFFNHSLEAHKRRLTGSTDPLAAYWLKEQYSAFAEKIHTYSVAELVLVNQVGTFHIEENWNKYNFFRIHNLGEKPIVVTFRNKGWGIITIPPWECRSIRRPEAGYVAPVAIRADSDLISADSPRTIDSSDEMPTWNYFWPLRGGDPRFWTQGPGESYGSNGNANLLTTLRANNVTNTTLLFDWINAWDFNVGTRDPLTGLSIYRIGWYRDPHAAAYDLGDVPTYAPIEPETIIGDLLHQHGRIVYTLDNTAKEVDYKGYGTLALDFAATGISVTEDADGNLVLTGVGTGYAEKLIAIGCNLFANGSSGAYALNHIIDLQGGPVTLDNRMPVVGQDPGPTFPNVSVLPISILNGTTSYSDSGGNVILADVPYRGLKFETPDHANPISIHRHTVADVLKLNWIGTNALVAGNQDTRAATFSNRRLQWTMFGLVLLCDQVLQLGNGFEVLVNPGPGLYRNATVLNSPINPLTTIDGSGGQVTISNKVLITFDTWGWGDSKSPHCLAPQVGRIYSNLKVTPGPAGMLSIHPELFNDAETIDGADFDETDVIQTETAITAITPISLVPTDGGYFPVWKEPDNLREAVAIIASGKNYDTIHVIDPFGWCPRLPMEFWHFNTMAAWVNALTRIVPMDYTFAPTLTQIRPHTTQQTNVLPMDGFAEFGVGDILDAFIALGVPILTAEDFPPSYQRIKDQTRRPFYGGITYEDTIIDRSGAPADDGGDPLAMFTAEYTLQRRFTGVSFSPGDPEDLLNALDIAFGGDIGNVSQYHWVRIKDVKDAIERLGWKFFYRELFLPLSLELVDVPPPSLMYDRPLHDIFTVEQPEYVDGQPPGGYWNAIGATIQSGLTKTGPFNFSYYDKEPVFVQRPGTKCDWKTGALGRRACQQFHPGDAYQFGLSDSGSGLDNNSLIGSHYYEANTPGFIKFDVPDAFRKAVRLRSKTYYGDWVESIVIQKYCSEDYSVVEKAVTNPISSIEHQFDNWSTQSIEKAMTTIAAGAEASPIQYRAPIGMPAIRPVFNGADTYLENLVEHSAFEILETIHPDHIIPD